MRYVGQLRVACRNTSGSTPPIFVSPRRLPLGKEHTSGTESLDPAVVEVSYPHIAMIVNGNPMGAVELPFAVAETAPSRQQPTRSIKLLDSAVVGNVDTLLAVYRDGPGFIELSISMPRRAPLGHERTCAVELLDPAVACFGHVHVALTIHGHTHRAAELSVPRPESTPLSNKRTCSAELPDATPTPVRNVQDAISCFVAVGRGRSGRRRRIDSDAAGALELASGSAGAAQLAYKRAQQVPADAVLSHLS